MDFIWKITYIWPKEEVGQNLLPKIVFVVEETEGQYPNSISIDLIKEKTDLISNYKVWDLIKVNVNFRAREYNWKYFTNISARRMEKVSESTESKNKEQKNKPVDDLPF